MERKEVTVKTTRGRPDSLKRSITIAFTITPDEPSGRSCPYNPLALSVKSFEPNEEDSTNIVWLLRPILGVGTVSANKFTPHSGCTYPRLGQVVTLTSSNTWSAPALDSKSQSSVSVVNESESVHNILLGSYWWQVAYNISYGGSITIPRSSKLQAYIVGGAVVTGTVLKPDDLKSPIFPVPILRDDLPENSTWMLTEDDEGVVRISNDNFPPVVPAETAVPPSIKKDPLAEILERLTLIEGSIEHLRDDFTAGQTAVDGIQTRLSILESTTKADREESQTGMATVTAEVATIAASFGRSQDQLSMMQGAVTETQDLLRGAEKSTHDRFSALEESADRTQKHVAAVEKSIHQTQDHVSVVQQLVVSSNSQLSLMKLVLDAGGMPEAPSPSHTPAVNEDKRIPAVEARVEKLERSTQEQRKVLRKLPKLEADLGVVQLSVTNLDGRVTAIEVGSGDGDIGVGDLSSSPSINGSPVMFPTHPPERAATTDL